VLTGVKFLLSNNHVTLLRTTICDALSIPCDTCTERIDIWNIKHIQYANNNYQIQIHVR